MNVVYTRVCGHEWRLIQGNVRGELNYGEFGDG
jgi:hypothetical protein